MIKKKKNSKDKEKKKERSLQTILNEKLRFSGLFFPKKGDNPELYKIPNTILNYYKRYYDCGDLFDENNIEIVYTVDGELYCYYSIDVYYTGRVVDFVFFDIGYDNSYKDNVIYKLSCISAYLSTELSYNVTLRCVFLQPESFFDNTVMEKMYKEYDRYICDASFFTKITFHNTDMLYKRRLVKSIDKVAVLRYDNDNVRHDAVYDLRKYATCLNSDAFIKEILPITGLAKNSNFALDKNRVHFYSSDIKTSSLSYIGFSKIYFILPNVPKEELIKFISTVFADIGDDVYQVMRDECLFKRFGFFVHHSVGEYAKLYSKDLEDPINLYLIDDVRSGDRENYIEVTAKMVYYTYYQKTS